MALSDQTIKKLAIALTPEVINSIYGDNQWMDFMCEVVPEIVSEKLGSQDIDLVTEIGTYIIDNILLKPQTV